MANKLYEENHVKDVADAIREKNGVTNTYKISEMGAAIRAIKTEPKLQNKTITENGTYTADSEFDGLGEVTVEVESSGGLENGYNIMFYDDSNRELEFRSIRQGLSIDAPIYTCKAWKTSDKTPVVFPITPTGDMDIFANNDTYAKQLYDYYGIDNAIYPYVAISISPQYSGSSLYYWFLVFTKSIDRNTTSFLNYGESIRTVAKIYGLNVDVSNVQAILDCVMENIATFDDTNNSISPSSTVICANFELPFTPNNTFHRLDV